MKYFNITLLFVIFALACHLSFTVAEEAGPAGGKRIALRRPTGKAVGKPSSTTTQAPAEDEEGDYNENGEETQYGDEAEGDSSSSTTTTTTETPKRIGPVIRPFRSNDDFLTSLKRRQMNAKNKKVEKPAPIKPSKPAYNQDQEEEEGEESAPVAAPAPGKAFNKPNSALNRRKLNKPSKPEPVEDTAAEESEQEPKEEEAKPKRPLGRLALRKRN